MLSSCLTLYFTLCLNKVGDSVCPIYINTIYTHIGWAIFAFLVFYVICLVITWFYYTRPGALLHGMEHRQTVGKAVRQPA